MKLLARAAAVGRRGRSPGESPVPPVRVARPSRPATLAAMPDHPRCIVVMPAYNAARTLERTYADIPAGTVDHVILVDDVSKDETVDIALGHGVHVVQRRFGQAVAPFRA